MACGHLVSCKHSSGIYFLIKYLFNFELRHSDTSPKACWSQSETMQCSSEVLGVDRETHFRNFQYVIIKQCLQNPALWGCVQAFASRCWQSRKTYNRCLRIFPAVYQLHSPYWCGWYTWFVRQLIQNQIRKLWKEILEIVIQELLVCFYDFFF